MNRKLKYAFITVLAFSPAAQFAHANDALIRKQFADYFVQTFAHESSVGRNLEHIRNDGTWEDIDYASQRRGDWPTRIHLSRLQPMAAAYANPKSDFYKDPAMKKAVLSGLNHWIENDYSNPNWWYGRIGIPKTVAAACILMGDDLPNELLQAARPLLDRSEMGMTGQNKTWCAGIALMKGLLYGDETLMKTASDAIWSELRISTKEGIQPDWSFHQHGPQQQFGNYGLAFGSDMIRWGSVLRNTPHALAEGKLEILRNYLLEGPAWILWNGRLDLSGCGRQVDKGCQPSKGRSIQQQLNRMAAIDPEFKTQYMQALAEPNERVGFKPFWRSDMAVQRRKDWYASVKMSSSRMIGSETCNSENMQGLHLGDGVLLLYQSGKEYEDIQPLWDWKRLPGTTCDQGYDKLTPLGWRGGYGGSDFAGALGDGETGVAAMIYKQEGLEAHKAWFFLEDEIICLGAGISGATKGPVYTSLQQSWLQGEVKNGKDWIQHDGVGYQFFDGEPVLETGAVSGNWNTSFPTRGDRPAEGEIFSLWIDHGKNPVDDTYAYIVYPGAEAGEMVKRTENPGAGILRNDAAVQAVQTDDEVYAVFYEAESLKCDDGLTILVEEPCMLILNNGRLTVCDPQHMVEKLHITIDGKKRSIKLPSGAERGIQVVVK